MSEAPRGWLISFLSLYPPAFPLPLSCPSSITPFPQMAQVIVVGGGLAGLSAAHTLLERGANVLLLDKQG